MSLPESSPLLLAGPHGSSRLHSTEHRFRVMQAATTLVALLLIGTTFLTGLQFHMRQKNRLVDLQSGLSLLTRMRTSFEVSDLAFWKAYRERSAEQERKYDHNSRKMPNRAQQLSPLASENGEARVTIALLLAQQQYLALTHTLLDGSRTVSAGSAALNLVGERSSALSTTLRRLEEDRLQGIAVVDSNFDRLMFELGGLLLVLAALTLGAEAWFLRA